jgi:hypothetical protein
VAPTEKPRGSRFSLQFAIEEVADYAARFPYENDGEVMAMGAAARERGYYTREEFIGACVWKTGRVRRRLEDNSEQAVGLATRVALDSAVGERERVAALLGLDGVSWGRASTLLHLALPDLYPILDRRAVHALGARWPSGVSFAFWCEFVDVWRQLRERAGLSGRIFDRALWQWSSEQEEQDLYPR